MVEVIIFNSVKNVDPRRCISTAFKTELTLQIMRSNEKSFAFLSPSSNCQRRFEVLKLIWPQTHWKLFFRDAGRPQISQFWNQIQVHWRICIWPQEWMVRTSQILICGQPPPWFSFPPAMTGPEAMPLEAAMTMWVRPDGGYMEEGRRSSLLLSLPWPPQVQILSGPAALLKCSHANCQIWLWWQQLHERRQVVFPPTFSPVVPTSSYCTWPSCISEVQPWQTQLWRQLAAGCVGGVVASPSQSPLA